MTALLAIFDADLGIFDTFVLIALVFFVVATVLALLEKPHAATMSYIGLASFALANLWLTP